MSVINSIKEVTRGTHDGGPEPFKNGILGSGDRWPRKTIRPPK